MHSFEYATCFGQLSSFFSNHHTSHTQPTQVQIQVAFIITHGEVDFWGIFMLCRNLGVNNQTAILIDIMQVSGV